jgi:hypothetical protein
MQAVQTLSLGYRLGCNTVLLSSTYGLVAAAEVLLYQEACQRAKVVLPSEPPHHFAPALVLVRPAVVHSEVGKRSGYTDLAIRVSNPFNSRAEPQPAILLLTGHQVLWTSCWAASMLWLSESSR